MEKWKYGMSDSMKGRSGMGERQTCSAWTSRRLGCVMTVLSRVPGIKAAMQYHFFVREKKSVLLVFADSDRYFCNE
jgi:hypothetical protein